MGHRDERPPKAWAVKGIMAIRSPFSANPPKLNPRRNTPQASSVTAIEVEACEKKNPPKTWIAKFLYPAIG